MGENTAHTGIGSDSPRHETQVLRLPGGADIRLSYRHAGQGQALVWLHWLWGEPGWMPHHTRLAEFFHLYVPDLPGYGRSTAPEWVRTPHDLALLLLRFLDSVALQRPILVGSCLGGWVAAELALLRPERLSQLVLIAPLGLVQDWTAVPNIFYTDPARLAGYFFTEPEGEHSRAYVPRLADWHDTFIQSRSASIRLVFDPYLHDRSLVHRLFLLTTPTLVLWGTDDPLLDSSHTALWTSSLPQAHSALIPDAGHLPYVENRDAVIQAIRTFAAARKGAAQ